MRDHILMFLSSDFNSRTWVPRDAVNSAVVVLFVCLFAGCATTFSGTFMYEDDGLPDVKLTIHYDDKEILTTTKEIYEKDNDKINFDVKIPKCEKYEVYFEYKDWKSSDPKILTQQEIKNINIDDRPPTSTIRGIVVDSKTLSPVKNAKIELLERDRFGEMRVSNLTEPPRKTNTEGEFEISGVRPGYYYIRIDHPPFHKIKRNPESEPYRVRLGLNWDAGTIELEKTVIY